MLARAIMAGTKLGVFEALAAGPLACDEVAERLRHGPPGHGQAAQRPDRRRLCPLRGRALQSHPGGAPGPAGEQPQLLARPDAAPLPGVALVGLLRGLRADRAAAPRPRPDDRRGVGHLPAGHALGHRDAGPLGGPTPAGAPGGDGDARPRRRARLLLGRPLPPVSPAAFHRRWTSRKRSATRRRCWPGRGWGTGSSTAPGMP